jgi:hypothetical protein
MTALRSTLNARGKAMQDDRKYYFVKHGLDAFQTMPNFIWRTGERDEPAAFTRVKKGDRWIAFAYTTSDRREKPLSQISGFYECVRTARYGRLPDRAARLPGRFKSAWLIEGKAWGKQPAQPVGVPPIDELLQNKKHFKGQTLVPITDGEKAYERIRAQTLARELNTSDIPFLGREPRNEQEVLAVVLFCHHQLGIERIIRVRAAFPDLLVKLKGRTEPVHLELETYSKSFLAHGHDAQVRNHCFKTEDAAEKRPVGVLCWIDNEKSPKLMKCVHKVYQLQELIREKKRIWW